MMCVRARQNRTHSNGLSAKRPVRETSFDSAQAAHRETAFFSL
jgi:hypothetical protein